MPSGALASTGFLTGPGDNLAAIDVYSGTAGGIINSIQSLAAKYDVNLIGMLRSGAAAAKLLPLVQGVANGQLLMNPQNAIARILSASNTLVQATSGGSVNSAFSALSSSIQASIGTAAQMVGSVEASVGSVVSGITNGAIGDIQSLGKLINSFSGSSPFMLIDNQALGGVAAGVINQCASLGVSGVFESMVSQITSPTVLSAIVKQTLPGLVRTGDLASLRILAAVASAAGISSLNPSAISQFVQTYSRTAYGCINQATPALDSSTFTQMLAVFDAAAPSWNFCTRASQGVNDSAIDLSSIVGGTSDFTSALAAGVANTTDADTQLYGIAVTCSATDVDSLLKSMYPNSYIDPALRTGGMAVDPSQVDTASGVSAATSTTAIQLSHVSNTATTQSSDPSSAQSVPPRATDQLLVLHRYIPLFFHTLPHEFLGSHPCVPAGQLLQVSIRHARLDNLACVAATTAVYGLCTNAGNFISHQCFQAAWVLRIRPMPACSWIEDTHPREAERRVFCIIQPVKKSQRQPPASPQHAKCNKHAHHNDTPLHAQRPFAFAPCSTWSGRATALGPWRGRNQRSFTVAHQA
ncbi:hypothetical protein [Paraburkholderia sp. J10-1]|uniref:hypothetical protein n=1 Tax=Paraburkholderia sp. J10-1 TaxID=2805430 RepID=UPI002AB65024|nr:hypothetical protein [Paraburkholderia sp. J10-1]